MNIKKTKYLVIFRLKFVKLVDYVEAYVQLLFVNVEIKVIWFVNYSSHYLKLKIKHKHKYNVSTYIACNDITYD